jgi:hypothetical protein
MLNGLREKIWKKINKKKYSHFLFSELLLVTFFGVIYLYCQGIYNNTSDVMRVLACL